MRRLDTSMGFTPTAGLVMSSRSGDLDPGLVSYLTPTEQQAARVFLHLRSKVTRTHSMMMHFCSALTPRAASPEAP